MTTNEYNGSTAHKFDDRFSNRVGIARLRISSPVGFNFDNLRDLYIRELEESIKQNLPEYDGVTNEHLREMIELSRNKDWADMKIINLLYSARDRIRGIEGTIDMNQLKREGLVDANGRLNEQ